MNLKDIEQASYTAPVVVKAHSGILDNLNADISQLERMMQQAEFSGGETAVRVKDPRALLSDLRDAVATIRALQTTQPEPAFAASIAEVVKEESLGGAACGWKSCTGCLETSDGYHCGTYPYSDTFKTHVGSGCRECGGLGVVWEHYSKEALEDMQREPEPAVKVDEWQPIATCPTTHVLFYGRTAHDKDVVFEGWKSVNGLFYAGDSRNNVVPTHWMPLPDAPLNRIGGDA